MLKLGQVIPGGGFALGIVFFYLSLLIFLPLGAFVLYASGMSGESFIQQVTDYRMVHGYALSFGCALAAAVINAVFGLLLAWVLVRYDFPGKRLMDGLIDLPFARGIGEYGSVVFIAGNVPFETEIAPLLIMTKLEQFDYQAAAAVAIVMLAMSLLVLLILNGYQHYRLQRLGA